MSSQGLPNARLIAIRQMLSAFFPSGGDADSAGVVRKRPSNLLYDVDETPPLVVEYIFPEAPCATYIILSGLNDETTIRPPAVIPDCTEIDQTYHS